MNLSLSTINSRTFKAEIENILKITLEGRSSSTYALFKGSLEKLNNNIKNSPCGILGYLDDYPLIFGFDNYQKRRANAPINHLTLKKDEELKNFIYFLIGFYRCYQALDKQGRKDLAGKLERGLNVKLLPLQHEIETFCHLYKEFDEIIFGDHITRDKPMYDFLIRKGKFYFEVECKTIGRYSGLSIIEAAAIEFFTKLNRTHLLEKVPNCCIIRFDFDGCLVQGKKNAKDHTAEELLDVFYRNLEKKTNIVIEEISLPPIIDRKWLADKTNAILKEFPGAYVSFPFPSSDRRAVFLALNPLNNENKYLAKLQEQIRYAAESQFSKKVPGIIFLYPEGLSPSYLIENKDEIIQLLYPLLALFETPLMLCVRSQFSQDLDQKAGLIKIPNKHFSEAHFSFF